MTKKRSDCLLQNNMSTKQKEKIIPVPFGIMPTKVENEECSHDLRIIENFYKEISKEERIYAGYCTNCLSTISLRISISNKK